LSCTGAYYYNASRNSLVAAADAVGGGDGGTHYNGASYSNNCFGNWLATASQATHSCYSSEVAGAAGRNRRTVVVVGTTHKEGSCYSGAGRAAAMVRRDLDYCSTVRLLTMTQCNHNSS
jgi:hypothetical protein